MISLLQNEIVAKKKWISEKEYMDVVAIAESTPGPIAINCATYVGYKMLGLLGAVIATIAIVIPSFVIILIISLFFDRFLQIELVAKAFKGIKAAVGVLILSAGIRMFVKSKKNLFFIILFVLTAAVLILINIYGFNFSTIYLIMIGGGAGILATKIGETARIAKDRKMNESGSNDCGEDKKDDLS